MKRTMRSLRFRGLLGVLPVIAATMLAASAFAQLPDKFTNLKVLPKEISKQDLTTVMRGFASSLGVRCGFCHARSEANPQGEPDWASDAKPEKETARVMVSMARRINVDEIPKITVKNPDRVEVRCRTCHHGLDRPRLIEDVLSVAYKGGGLDSLKARYESLRKQYYGTDSYNFGDSMLPSLAEQLLGTNNPAASLAIAQYNLHWFPDSGYAHMTMGQAQAAAGDKEAALGELKKAVELRPDLKEEVQWIIDHLPPK